MTPKLVAPLLSSETRLDGASLRVSRLLPCSDFDLQGIAIWDAPIPARAAEDSNLNLRHVEPACVFWRAVKLHAAPKIVGRLRTQHIIEAFSEVGVAVVKHQVPAVRFTQYADTPYQSAPGLELVFFNMRRTVSLLTPDSPGSWRATRSNSTIVQRCFPVGGVEHANAVTRACASVSYWRGRPERSPSKSARPTPPCKYAARVRQTAVRPIPSTVMIWDCATPRSRQDNTCARFTSRDWCSPLARIPSTTERSSSLRCNSLWRMTTPVDADW